MYPALLAPIASLAPIATTCVAPSLLPHVPHYVAPICPVMLRSNELTLRIYGSSVATQRKVFDAISTLQTKTPIVGDYIDFVFSYLENFSVRICTQESLPHQLRPGGSSYGASAAYDPTTRTLILQEQEIETIGFHMHLRHEFRHAYWHAMQIYSFGNVGAGDTNCIHPNTPQEMDKVRRFIDEGDAAVETLAQQLFKEGKKQLSLQEAKELENLRAKCKKHDDLYQTHSGMQTLEANVNQVQVGKTYPMDISLEYLFGAAEVLSKQLTPTPQITVRITDPLRRFVCQVRAAQRSVGDLGRYSREKYVYEREAHLYGDAPLPLVKKFYPKLFKYVTDLGRRAMANPHPLGIGRAANTALLSLDYLQRVAYISSHDMLDELRAFRGDANLIKVLDHVLDQRIAEGSVDIVNRMNYALTYLVQNGLPIGNAYILMAKYAHEQDDGLNACRYYHRAFKHAADFSFDDYLSCIDVLLENNKLGDVKTFCQRVRRSYLNKYGFIPFEIEIRWSRIKKLRSGTP